VSPSGLLNRVMGGLPQVRILPLTIGVAALCLCVRTVDLISLATTGEAIPVQTAKAETAPAKPAKAEKPAPAPAPLEAVIPAQQKQRPQEPSFSASEIQVLQSLAERRAALEAREQALDGREALLKAAEQRVDQKVAELNRLKEELENLVRGQKKAEDAQSESLVKIYENMKPKDAARIFDTLDIDVLLEVVGRMKELKTAPILAAMEEGRARELTTRLHQRRQLPGGGETGASHARN
jgi:flagellar motility protein MotE (MotC chaperone)